MNLVNSEAVCEIEFSLASDWPSDANFPGHQFSLVLLRSLISLMQTCTLGQISKKIKTFGD